MLTVTIASRRFVAEDRAGILETFGQRLLLVMIKIEAADRGCIFRSQAESALMQAKRIKILPQLLPKAGQEEIALLQNRRIDGGISRLRQEFLQVIGEPTLPVIVLRQQVIHAAQPLNALFHNDPLLFISYPCRG